MASSPPLLFACSRPVAVGVVAWPDAWRALTVIVKRRIVVAPSGAVTVADEVAPLRLDLKDAEGELLFPSDFAPYKPHCDVVAIGTLVRARAMPGVLAVGSWSCSVGERVSLGASPLFCAGGDPLGAAAVGEWAAGQFDFSRFQAAAANQRIPFPSGGVDVSYARGAIRMTASSTGEPPQVFVLDERTGGHRRVAVSLDTIAIDPGSRSVECTYRGRIAWPIPELSAPLLWIDAGAPPATLSEILRRTRLPVTTSDRALSVLAEDDDDEDAGEEDSLSRTIPIATRQRSRTVPFAPGHFAPPRASPSSRGRSGETIAALPGQSPVTPFRAGPGQPADGARESPVPGGSQPRSRAATVDPTKVTLAAPPSSSDSVSDQGIEDFGSQTVAVIAGSPARPVLPFGSGSGAVRSEPRLARDPRLDVSPDVQPVFGDSTVMGQSADIRQTLGPMVRVPDALASLQQVPPATAASPPPIAPALGYAPGPSHVAAPGNVSQVPFMPAPMAPAPMAPAPMTTAPMTPASIAPVPPAYASPPSYAPAPGHASPSSLSVEGAATGDAELRARVTQIQREIWAGKESQEEILARHGLDAIEWRKLKRLLTKA